MKIPAQLEKEDQRIMVLDLIAIVGKLYVLKNIVNVIILGLNVGCSVNVKDVKIVGISDLSLYYFYQISELKSSKYMLWFVFTSVICYYSIKSVFWILKD